MPEECTHDCSSCGADCSSREPASLLEPANVNSTIKKVIGIVSGKGGVGKSLITSLLASNMQRRGNRTAIMDADVTGPSIPKMFGLTGRATASDTEIFPVDSANGTRIISVNLLLENPSDPVVWRGPVIAGMVKQFWTEVNWGNVDYMFVDMPPGTGDVPLTVFQSLPLDGIVIVTSPQELVSMIVDKAVKMSEMMNIPIIGIVENMSYFKCPNCDAEHKIYGESHIDELAASHNIDTVAKLPIEPTIASACDAGEVEKIAEPWLDGLCDKIEKL